MKFTRRNVVAAGIAALATPAAAHHGWRWTDGGAFELTGLIVEARPGNPHGRLTIDANGELWTAEVGQPWRNARAGLTDAMMSEGTEITLLGERSSDPAELRMKVEVVVIDGTRYVLYPERV